VIIRITTITAMLTRTVTIMINMAMLTTTMTRTIITAMQDIITRRPQNWGHWYWH